MKTIEQLEQEAKQAREALNSELTEICGAILAKPLVDSIINAAVAMVTYKFALGMENADQIWNESGTTVISEKLPEVSGDGSGESLTEVSQEERDSDGWIVWNGDGHDCPIPENLKIEARFANGDINNAEAGQFRWHHVGNGYDLIAYRIVKGE